MSPFKQLASRLGISDRQLRRYAEEGKVVLRRLGSQEQQTVTVEEAVAILTAEATPPDLR